MKRYLVAMLVTATIALAGCGMSKEQMMMMDDMKSQLNSIEFQVNSNAAAAARAKDMAEEAIVKASMKGGSRHMMHRKNMTK